VCRVHDDGKFVAELSSQQGALHISLKEIGSNFRHSAADLRVAREDLFIRDCLLSWRARVGKR
jgi:hypothetical protein